MPGVFKGCNSPEEGRQLLLIHEQVVQVKTYSLASPSNEGHQKKSVKENKWLNGYLGGR